MCKPYLIYLLAFAIVLPAAAKDDDMPGQASDTAQPSGNVADAATDTGKSGGETAPASETDRDPVTGMEFVKISPGCFQMGSPDNESGRIEWEGPQHKVCVGGFYIGKTEVTQEQWKKVTGKNPSKFKGDNNPVERISWEEVREFIDKLNEQAGTRAYRLPTEAEWEYAARAGTATSYFFGNDLTLLGDYVWHDTNMTTAVGQRKPNPWGLYDVHGNVWEWVQDSWHDNYEGAPADGSAWEDDTVRVRVSRGGCWYEITRGCRSAIRFRGGATSRYAVVGFRLAKSLP